MLNTGPFLVFPDSGKDRCVNSVVGQPGEECDRNMDRAGAVWEDRGSIDTTMS